MRFFRALRGPLPAMGFGPPPGLRGSRAGSGDGQAAEKYLKIVETQFSPKVAHGSQMGSNGYLVMFYDVFAPI